MQLYWREHRLGQRLFLLLDRGEEVEVGAVRRTPRGYSAFAKVFGYAPGTAESGFTTLEEAKAFVESFRPWEQIEGALGLEVEPGVRPLER